MVKILLVVIFMGLDLVPALLTELDTGDQTSVRDFFGKKIHRLIGASENYEPWAQQNRNENYNTIRRRPSARTAMYRSKYQPKLSNDRQGQGFRIIKRRQPPRKRWISGLDRKNEALSRLSKIGVKDQGGYIFGPDFRPENFAGSSANVNLNRNKEKTALEDSEELYKFGNGKVQFPSFWGGDPEVGSSSAGLESPLISKWDESDESRSMKGEEENQSDISMEGELGGRLNSDTLIEPSKVKSADELWNLKRGSEHRGKTKPLVEEDSTFYEESREPGERVLSPVEYIQKLEKILGRQKPTQSSNIHILPVQILRPEDTSPVHRDPKISAFKIPPKLKTVNFLQPREDQHRGLLLLEYIRKLAEILERQSPTEYPNTVIEPVPSVMPPSNSYMELEPIIQAVLSGFKSFLGLETVSKSKSRVELPSANHYSLGDLKNDHYLQLRKDQDRGSSPMKYIRTLVEILERQSPEDYPDVIIEPIPGVIPLNNNYTEFNPIIEAVLSAFKSLPGLKTVPKSKSRLKSSSADRHPLEDLKNDNYLQLRKDQDRGSLSKKYIRRLVEILERQSPEDYPDVVIEPIPGVIPLNNTYTEFDPIIEAALSAFKSLPELKTVPKSKSRLKSSSADRHPLEDLKFDNYLQLRKDQDRASPSKKYIRRLVEILERQSPEDYPDVIIEPIPGVIPLNNNYTEFNPIIEAVLSAFKSLPGLKTVPKSKSRVKSSSADRHPPEDLKFDNYLQLRKDQDRGSLSKKYIRRLVELLKRQSSDDYPDVVIEPIGNSRPQNISSIQIDPIISAFKSLPALKTISKVKSRVESSSAYHYTLGNSQNENDRPLESSDDYERAASNRSRNDRPNTNVINDKSVLAKILKHIIEMEKVYGRKRGYRDTRNLANRSTELRQTYSQEDYIE